MSRPRKYPQELLERGVRLALESGRPIRHVAADLGIHPETLRKWVRRAEADAGLRPDLPTTEEREEIRRLRQENFATPTLMIQGADDRCDESAGSADQERFFTGGYRRLLLDGVGHFPHREAPDAVAAAIDEHLRTALTPDRS